MSTAPDLEARIARGHRALVAIADRIRRGDPLDGWPDDLRRAFLLALAADDLPLAETWKVTALRRHLFGETALPSIDARARASPPPSTDDRIAAERVRADLARHVGLRSAAHLLPPRPPGSDPGL